MSLPQRGRQYASENEAGHLAPNGSNRLDSTPTSEVEVTIRQSRTGCLPSDYGNRLVASSANDRAGHLASGHPGNRGKDSARPRKYPKALAASAADDSGLSNFPLSISLPGAFPYMRSISRPGTPERNRRTLMTKAMAAPTPRRRHEPFGLHPSTRSANISGMRLSRPETVPDRTFLGRREREATSITLRRSSASRDGRVACSSLPRIFVRRRRDSTTGAPRLQARHVGRPSTAGHERAIHSDVRDKTNKTCRIEGSVATQRKARHSSISIPSGGRDDLVRTSERGRRRPSQSVNAENSHSNRTLVEVSRHVAVFRQHDDRLFENRFTEGLWEVMRDARRSCQRRLERETGRPR